MVKALEVYFSNRLEILYQQLKSSLFSSPSSPFMRRIVVVYGPAMKTWLMLKMADDPELNVAMGIEFIYLNQAFELLLGLTGKHCHLPTLLELTLAIEAELKKMLLCYPSLSPDEKSDWEAVLRYLKLNPDNLKISRKLEKRLTGLSQHLARLFKDYGRYAYQMVSQWSDSKKGEWQIRLWLKLFGTHSPFSYPADALRQEMKVDLPFHLHFFSISYVTPSEFSFLDRLAEHVPVHYYLLSPCAIFWSDIRSDRESASLQRYWQQKLKSHSSELLTLEELLQDRNPLLANFGRLGREIASQIEESSAVTAACYSLPHSIQNIDPESFLHPDLQLVKSDQPLSLLDALQGDLLMMRNPKAFQKFNFEEEKGSLQLHVAVSKRREVEILYHQLLHLMAKDPSLVPSEVIVLSPQMHEYVPYIQSIFGAEQSPLDFQILDLGLHIHNESVQGFLQLVNLSESRWDAMTLLQLFEHPAFQRCQQLSSADFEIIRGWIEKVGIRWGENALHRNEILQKRHSQKEMVEDSIVGTWEWGISRLILGLMMATDPNSLSLTEFSPCPIVDFSQTELLGKWVRLLHALREDLSPLHDSTSMTVDDWVNYLHCLLECYFKPDHESSSQTADFHSLKELFEALRYASQWVKEENYPFYSIKSALLSLLQSKHITYQEEHLQAIRFCSLMPLRSIPAKVIALLGMQEGAFPRIESSRSLNLILLENQAEYYPLSQDFDRYLFLEALHSAQDYLLLSYIGYHQKENKELKPCLVIEELFSYLDQFYTIQGKKVSECCLIKHPFDSFDKSYFEKDSKLPNYFVSDFFAAQALYKPIKEPPYAFLSDFHREDEPGIEATEIDLKYLTAVARDPVKFYLNKGLEIYLETEEEREIKTNEKWTLTPLDQSIFRQKALKIPHVSALSFFEREGKLPLGLFKTVACQHMEKEAIKIDEGLQKHTIHPSELFQMEFCKGCTSPTQVDSNRWLLPPITLESKIVITGIIPFVSSEGLVLLNKHTFGEVWKGWPQFLLYCHAVRNLPGLFKPNLIMPQGQKLYSSFFDDPEPYLKKFINYYTLCLNHFSPLLPDWIPLIIKGKSDELQKKIEQLFDPSFGRYQSPYLPWSLNRSLLPSAEKIIQEWQQEAIDLAGELIENWFPKKRKEQMKPFLVGDRSQSVHQHYLLEASAGTGKTFSIQNIVLRLLIEAQGKKEPLPLEKILIVTFTKAATRDLKRRIRSNLEQALQLLEKKETEIDYLQALLEKGGMEIDRAKRRLKQALFSFDQAQIFTIHSFCARMLKHFALEADMGLHAPSEDDPFPLEEMKELIRDFFLTEIRLEHYSPAQIAILLHHDPHQKELIRQMKRGLPFCHIASYSEIYARFEEAMHSLQSSFSLRSDKIIDDFQKQASFYKNYSNDSKEEVLAIVNSFAKLFDKREWCQADLDSLLSEGFVWTKALNPQLVKKSIPDAFTLHYPGLTEAFKKTLEPLIDQAGDYATLLAQMAHHFHHYVCHYQQEEEKHSPDDLLRKMDAALANPLFLAQIRASYQAVIIDEFQDTDPLQWQIFKTLFLSDNDGWNGYLYLVGDPKQSIYSFRQADIYTYLDAAQKIGKEQQFSLNVNYRSQPKLVEALNLLFDEKHLPHFVPLPKKKVTLPCPPVHTALTEDFTDERGAIHFFIANEESEHKIESLERNYFFPFIAQEIERLKDQKGLEYQHFAVLVKDRYQARRLSGYFKFKAIPFVNQRGLSLANDSPLRSLVHLLIAILHPHDRSATYAALGTPLIGWKANEIQKHEGLEFILGVFENLRSVLAEKGFACFYRELLSSKTQPNGKTIIETILAREEGLEFYHQFQQIAELIIDHQFREWHSPEGIISFLDQFSVWEQNEDERVKRFEDPMKKGVKILSLHVSKGLEFEIVFALGLITRYENKDSLIPIELNGKRLLTPLSAENGASASYFEECDAEKMRLLYVAFTRAKKLLYVPISFHMPVDKLEWGEASPIELFLARLNQPPASYSVLYERLKQDEIDLPFMQFMEENGKNDLLTYSLLDKVKNEVPLTTNEIEQPQLIPPPPVKIQANRRWMASFSSLHGNGDDKLSSQMPSPSDYQAIIKDIHTLPANRETGLLVHLILEKIKFHDSENIQQIVRPFLQSTPFKEWEMALSSFVFNALKTPLEQVNSHFSLSMLKPHQFYKEIPFLFPYQQGGGIEEIDFQEGLIRGVIDLLFTYDGRYYLVDWKTNWLGNHVEAYEKEMLEIAMQTNGYFLQAAIYKEAIKRYLKLVDPRPFNECFGGAFYLFLRGMQPGKRTGIFHFS